MRRQQAFTAAGLSAVLIGLAGASARAESMVHLGSERQFYFREADATDGPPPVIFMLHGGGGGGAQIARSLASTLPEGWAYVFPDAIDRNWNDGRRTAEGALVHDADDSAFLAALALKLADEGRVDRNRIFVAGISNGGMMSVRLVCEHADIFLGAGVVAAAMQRDFKCAPETAARIIFIHGDADRLVPFDGGGVAASRRRDAKDRGEVHSIPDSVAFWTRENGCADVREGRVPDRAHDGMSSRYTLYAACVAPVAHIEVEGGGHAWPGVADKGRLRRRISGETTQDFNATATLATFFLEGRLEFPPSPQR